MNRFIFLRLFLLHFLLSFIFCYSACSRTGSKNTFIKDTTKNTSKDTVVVSGKVIKIIDGDTYDLLDKDSVTHRVRLAYVDAPEKGQDFWRVSKKKLGDLVLQKQVTIKILPIQDRNHRWIAETWVRDTLDISKAMLNAGMVWVYKTYRTDKSWMQLEEDAKQAKIGIWQNPTAIAPWEFRKRNKAAK